MTLIKTGFIWEVQLDPITATEQWSRQCTCFRTMFLNLLVYRLHFLPDLNLKVFISFFLFFFFCLENKRCCWCMRYFFLLCWRNTSEILNKAQIPSCTPHFLLGALLGGLAGWVQRIHEEDKKGKKRRERERDWKGFCGDRDILNQAMLSIFSSWREVQLWLQNKNSKENMQLGLVFASTLHC